MIDDLIHRARRCTCGKMPTIEHYRQGEDLVAVRVHCGECGRSGSEVEGAMLSAAIADDAIDNWNAATPIVKVR